MGLRLGEKNYGCQAARDRRMVEIITAGTYSAPAVFVLKNLNRGGELHV